jgi:Undecaprenyl-phosphate galactose phosphotransferase WbaP
MNFRRYKNGLRALALFVTDLFALWLAWLMAMLIASQLGKIVGSTGLLLSTQGGSVYALLGLMLTLIMWTRGQYTRRTAFWDETGLAWRYIGLAAVGSLALNFLVQTSNARTVPLIAWTLVLLLLPMGRLLNREWMIPAGYWQRKALIVGEGTNAHEAIAALKRERHMGISIAGTTSFEGRRIVHPSAETDEHGGIPAELMSQDVESMARQLGCEVIVVALDEESKGRAARLVRTLHAQQFEVFVVPALEGLPVHGLQAQHFLSNDVLIMRLQHRLLSPVSRSIKRLVDVVVASIALVLLSPLMAWVAWRIWREDGAPVIYSHTRVGFGCQDFPFFKFRSMVRDADQVLENWKTSDPDLHARYVASNFKLHDDPRILKVGRLIRRTSIDELPQLWNVLRGDMSLVGPRPLLRRELPMYSPDTFELYQQVRPGITGLWQVSGRSRTSFEQRAALDSWYVRNWSLWIDWVVLLKTIRVVLSGKGAV